MNPNDKKENNFWENLAQSKEGNRVDLKRVKDSEIKLEPKSIDGIVSQNKKEEIIILPAPVSPKETDTVTLEKKEIKVEEEKVKNIINETPKVSNKKFYILISLLFLFIFVASGTIFYFYKKSKKPVVVDTNTAQAQLVETVALVGKIAVLPENDEPVLAVVYDPTQLKNDAFFTDSVAGDKVLIYPNIGRAFLYRPSTNQMINIISFLPNSPESKSFSTSTAPSPTEATPP